MTWLGWWCFDLLSRMLEPGERAVARGDLVEAGVSSGQACGELLGLVARRQAALWRSWPPWTALLGIVYLLIPLLVQCLAACGETLTVYFTQSNLPVHLGLVMVCGSCLTFLWSWSCGFALAAISRRTIWIHGPLFYAAGILGVPYGLAGSIGAYGQLKGSFEHTMVTLVVQVFLFVLPSVWGLRSGLRTRRTGWFVLLATPAVIATLVGILAWSETWTPNDWLDRLSAYAILSWPVVYVVTKRARLAQPGAVRLTPVE